jgi:uncharacterized protein (TIGR03067 family)
MDLAAYYKQQFRWRDCSLLIAAAAYLVVRRTHHRALMSNDLTSCPEGSEEELKKFQGTWKQVGYERDGLIEPSDEPGWEPRTTFAGKEFVVTLADGSIPIKGTYRLDPTRTPKTVDWTDTIGENAGKTLLAIYSLNGDRLIFCAAHPGLERPTDFRTRPGQVLRVLQREAQWTCLPRPA